MRRQRPELSNLLERLLEERSGPDWIRRSGHAKMAGEPKELFMTLQNAGWDVSGDGKRFLMSVAPTRQNTQAPITLVRNWQADLKR